MSSNAKITDWISCLRTSLVSFSYLCPVALSLAEWIPIHWSWSLALHSSSFTLRSFPFSFLLALSPFSLRSSSFSLHFSSFAYRASCCCIRSNLHLDSFFCMWLQCISCIASTISTPFSHLHLVDELLSRKVCKTSMHSMKTSSSRSATTVET